MQSIKSNTRDIFLFILGLVIGWVLRSQVLEPSTLQFVNIVLITFTGSFGLLRLIIPIIKNSQEKKDKKRLRQDKLILKDLNNWISETTFSNIIYNFRNIKSIAHKDPVKLPFFDKAIEILKEYNAFSLWEKGKMISEGLKEEGVKALEKFHITLDKALEVIPLKKTIKIGILSEHYCSLFRVREAIYEEINGEHRTFLVYENPLIETKNGSIIDEGWLEHGAVRLAFGKTEIMKRLKEIIEELIKNKNMRNEIDVYNKAKRKMELLEHFLEFKSKIAEINKNFTWTEKLNR